MFEFLKKAGAWIKQKTTSSLHAISTYFLGDLPLLISDEFNSFEQELSARATFDNDEKLRKLYSKNVYEQAISNRVDQCKQIGVMRLGLPRFFGIHIALVQGSNRPELFEKQLKAFMETPEETARTPYQSLNLLTRASFLLGNNTKDAIALHKKFSRYLTPRKILDECIKELPELFEQLSKDSGINAIIKNFVNKLFSKVLLGVEATSSLMKIMDNLENNLSIETLIMPLAIQQFLPRIRKTRAEIDTACREFLREKRIEITKLLQTDGEDNLLLDALRPLHTQGIRLDKLTVAELDKIADLPDVRSAIFSLFAVGNAAHVMSSILSSLLDKMFENNSRILSLRNALDQQKNNKLDAGLLEEPDRLTLQALYNMGVLKHSRFTKLFRYVRKAIHTELLDIPANTLVIFDLNEKLNNNTLANSNSLAPENLIHKLDHGTLVPFGTGPRKCPAEQMVGTVCKYLMMRLIKDFEIKYARSIDENSVQLKVCRQTKENTPPSNSLSINHSVLFPTQSAKNNLTAEEPEMNMSTHKPC